MFNIITNLKNRDVIENISLEELVFQLKNPSVVHKKFVDKARTLGKESKIYEKIKSTLPCFVPNYNHKDYVKINTIEKSTGFIYIDVDYKLDIDFSDYSFVAAAWKSLSGIGNGIVVALDNPDTLGTDLKTMRTVINSVCEVLDIKADKAAVSRDRLNVIGYDYDTYYNPNFTKFNTSFEDNEEDKKVVIRENKKLLERLDSDYHFYDGELRMSNLDEMKENLPFEDDILFLDMADNPIKYTSVYIPKSIPVGSRNSTVFRILSTIKALNPVVKRERFFGVANYINNNICYEPMNIEELQNICNRLIATNVPLFANKVQKYPFNPIYTLTGRERSSIASGEHNRKEGKKNTDRILKAVVEWDTKKDGKFTIKALSIKIGLSYKTVLTRKKDIKICISENK
jgi:hypothetical protein